jgi:hypothetical protein
LVPYTLCVCRETICRDAAVVLGQEDGQFRLIEKPTLLGIVVTFPEAMAQLGDRLLEFLWL